MNAFYSYSVQSDLNNSNVNAVYLNDISLGLGRDYYQKNDDKSKKHYKNTRSIYQNY